LVGVLIWAAWESWPQGNVYWNARGRYARNILGMNSLWLLSAAALTVPAYAGSAISKERDGRTLDLLWCTGVGPMAFVASKLIASVSLYVLYLLVALPCVAALYFLVGVDYWSLAMVALFLLACAGAIAAAGLWASSRYQHGVGAMVAAYMVMLFVQGLAFALLYIILIGLGFIDFFSQQMTAVVIATLPFQALAMSTFNPGAPVGSPTTILTISFVVQIVWILFFGMLAYRAVRKRMFLAAPVPRGATISRVVTSKTQYRSRAKLRSGSSFMKFVTYESLRFLHPDRRLPRYLFLILFLAGVLPVGILYYARTVAADDNVRIYRAGLGLAYVLGVGLASILAPLFVAGYRIRERQSGSEDALRMTLLRPRTIFWGKLGGAFAVAALLWVAAVALDSVLWLGDGIYSYESRDHAFGIAFVAVGAMFSMSVAVLWGTYMKEVSGALVATYLSLLAWGILVPSVLPRIVRWAVGIEQWPAANRLQWLSPYFGMSEHRDKGLLWVRIVGYAILSLLVTLLGYRRFTKYWRRGEE
jgi:hypothetical protein